MTGSRNCKVKIITYGAPTIDAGGGVINGIPGSYFIWAKVESRQGLPVTGQSQTIWQYDYKITVMHEPSRSIKSNCQLEYSGKKMLIKSVSFENEGRRELQVLRCEAIDENI